MTSIVPPAPYHDEPTAHDPNSPVDPQVIVEALQRGSPLMSMSPAQLWREIGNARERSLSFEARLPESKRVAIDNTNSQQCSPGEERLEKHKFETSITKIATNELDEPLAASAEEDLIALNQKQTLAEDGHHLIDGEDLVVSHKETSVITSKPLDSVVSIIVESGSSIAKEQTQPTYPRSPSPKSSQTSLSDEMSDEADRSVPCADNFPVNEADNAEYESSESPASFHSLLDVETGRAEGISVSGAHDMELDSYTITGPIEDKADTVKIGIEVTNSLEQTELGANIPSVEGADPHLDMDLNGTAVIVPTETNPIETVSTLPEPIAADILTSQLAVPETMPAQKDTSNYIQKESEKTDIHVVGFNEESPNELGLGKAKENEKSEAEHSEGELNELNPNQDLGIAILQEGETVTTETAAKEAVSEKEVLMLEKAVPEETMLEETTFEETIPEEAVSEETITEKAVLEQAVPEQAVLEQVVTEQVTPEAAVPEEAVPEIPGEAVPTAAVPEDAVPNESTSQEGKPDGAMDELSTPADNLKPISDLVAPSEYSSLTSVFKTPDNTTSIAKNPSEPPSTCSIGNGQVPVYSDSVINERESGSPPNNDLCLVCNSTAFTGAESNPIAGQSSGDSTLKWIECDNCKCWTHNACVSLSNEEVDMIDKYHCATCEKEKGPSTCKFVFS